MLSERHFEVLYYCYKNKYTTQRDIAVDLGMSLGYINKSLNQFQKNGWLTEDMSVSRAGLKALEPYKVKNAIILAAGMSSRCAPLSYEKPKGLFKIKGEVLIERQIRQLHEKGISEIYVVVGYMKELFFYLEKKFGVHIIINNEYDVRNNLSSIYAVKNYFGNSYVCYSDNYIIENGYEPYVYGSYYAGMYSPEYTDEYIMNFDKTGLIHQYYQGGEESWYQMGEMYFSTNTAHKFIELLEREYNYPSIFDMKIDDFYARHLSELPISIKKCSSNFVREFDTIADIEQFDDTFIQNMGDNILTNICSVLSCKDTDIKHVRQIKRGMTNTIFSFVCKDKKYIYRHPGRGTEKIIDRAHEYSAQCAARDLGLDPTLVTMDPEKGWKLSMFIDNIDFNYANLTDEERGIKIIQKLHETPHKLGWDFDMMNRAVQMQSYVSADYYDAYKEFTELREKITKLYNYTLDDGYEKVMCHNDACDSNILLGYTDTYLIDWEYAGDNDPAADIATFIIGCDRDKDSCDRILLQYLGHTPSTQEIRHYYAYIAICGYFYFTWAIYKESTGQNIGSLIYTWYNFALDFSQLALDLYEEDK